MLSRFWDFGVLNCGFFELSGFRGKPDIYNYVETWTRKTRKIKHMSEIVNSIVKKYYSKKLYDNNLNK